MKIIFTLFLFIPFFCLSQTYESKVFSDGHMRRPVDAQFLVMDDVVRLKAWDDGKLFEVDYDILERKDDYISISTRSTTSMESTVYELYIIKTPGTYNEYDYTYEINFVFRVKKKPITQLLYYANLIND